MMMRRFPVLLGLLLCAQLALAVPLGYRYIGSLVVSGGRHVYWYWNACRVGDPRRLSVCR